jgi:serine/threonine protein kinase
MTREPMTPEQWQAIRPILESAIELEPERRREFLDSSCADSEIRSHVESLLSVHDHAPGEILQVAAPLRADADEMRFRVQAGKHIGIYKIIDEIAVGGMGAVYRALRDDGQYEQEVAIKIVRTELGGELTAQRFKNERQILANLDHPNIAKIIDGGVTSEGIPYLVMELIRGAPITQYCDEQRLAIPARLELFRKVCAAVHYAHGHLVVHRDIKPSNILVTGDGTPKLLDFGIAKILGSDASHPGARLTMDGALLMTPEYASPEQFQGASITTATDVYSLGLVLYELLSGCKALDVTGRSPHELARVVTEHDPKKPSDMVAPPPRSGGAPNTEDVESVAQLRSTTVLRLRRHLKGDLDNIVMQALRKETSDRYASVDQLSEDLRRYLDAEPVQASRHSLRYRLGKFVARNKVIVAAAASIALVVIAGSLAILREAQVARAEKARAEQRFNDVRQLANSFLFDVHDAIQFLPGSTAARQLLVRNALTYLDSLAKEAGDDRGLKRELANSYEKLGDVQGGYQSANLGDIKAAIQSYEHALEIRESLNGQPADKALLRELIRNHGKLSNLYNVAGNSSMSLQHSDALLKLAERLATDDPTNFETRRNLAAAKVDNGWMRASDDAWRTAVESISEGRDMLQALSKERPDDVMLARLNALANHRLGNLLYSFAKDYPAALASQREAATLLEGLLRKKALNTDLRNLHAHVLRATGDVLAAMGSFSDAVNMGAQAIDELQALVDADASNVQFRAGLSQMRGEVSSWLADAGDLEGAIRGLEQAQAEIHDIDVPENLQIKSFSAVQRFRLGLIYEQLSLQKRAHDGAAARVACEQAGTWYASSVADLRQVAEHHLLYGESATYPERAAKGVSCLRS